VVAIVSIVKFAVLTLNSKWIRSLVEVFEMGIPRKNESSIGFTLILWIPKKP